MVLLFSIILNIVKLFPQCINKLQLHFSLVHNVVFSVYILFGTINIREEINVIELRLS